MLQGELGGGLIPQPELQHALVPHDADALQRPQPQQAHENAWCWIPESSSVTYTDICGLLP
eukprot:scaffold29639_cov19-Tisochrysis_lutea.AAC.1